MTFAAPEDRSWSIFWRPADRSSERHRLIRRESSIEIAPESWSPEGQLLSFRDLGATGWDVLVFNRGTREVHAFLAQDFNEWGSAFSPDGKWLAYTSDESGDYEVYLQQYPRGRKVQVSTGGGNEEPLWSRDGRKLFFRNGRRWLCATDPSSSKFSPGDCQLVFQGDFINISGLDYDVMPDGKRFLVLQSADTPHHDELHVILNWFEQLALKGHTVDLYEASGRLGGKIEHCIPRERLPHQILEKELSRFGELGVNVHLNTPIDREKYEEIYKGHEVVIIAVGAQKGRSVAFPGSENITTAYDFLKETNSGKIHDLKGKKVVVIGAGNVGMDVASEAYNFGAESVIVLTSRSRLPLARKSRLQPQKARRYSTRR